MTVKIKISLDDLALNEEEREVEAAGAEEAEGERRLVRGAGGRNEVKTVEAKGLGGSGMKRGFGKSL